MKILSYLLILCIALLGVGFALLNHQEILVNYYFGEMTAPVSMVLTLTFVAGSLLGVLVGLYLTVKLKFAYFKLQNKLKAAEKELANLRHTSTDKLRSP